MTTKRGKKVEPKVARLKFTSFDIQQIAVRNLFRCGVEFIVPNINTGYGEADLFSLRRSGYAEEFEIKVSRSDFFADKKKTHKHHSYGLAFNGGTPVCDGIKRMPNRFSFIVPEYLNITEKDVPEYAGLYIVSNKGRFDCAKSPPVIHKNKNEWCKKAVKSIGYKYLLCMGFFKVPKVLEHD